MKHFPIKNRNQKSNKINRTTFNLDDWVSHTPVSILAKNFGVNESVFETVPTPDPYIINGTVSTSNITSPNGKIQGNSSYVYHLSQEPASPVPGGGGTLQTVDSRNFPIATTLAAAIVKLEPGGLRELHWHPNVKSFQLSLPFLPPTPLYILYSEEKTLANTNLPIPTSQAEEWLYFHQGTARATVFIGNANARTFDFTAGDTAVFPDNSGHYIENTSQTHTLIWLELYKSDRVADISLTQWLALTPADIVASTLKISLDVVKKLKTEKQLLIK